MTFTTLQQRHEALLTRQNQLAADDVRRRSPAAEALAADVRQFMVDAVAQSEQIADPRERDLLRAYLRYWATFIYDWSGVFPKTDLRPAALSAVGASGAVGAATPVSPAPSHGLSRWLPWLAGLAALLLVGWAVASWFPRVTAPEVGRPSPEVVTPLPPVTRTPLPEPEVAQPDETIGRENAGKVAELRRVDAHTNGALDVAFDPDRPEVATSGVDGVVRFWVVPTLELSRQLNDQPGWVRALAYSPYGDDSAAWPLVVTGGNDRALRAYDLESLQLFAEFRPTSGNSGFVFAAAFSPDGRLIASAHGDGAARIWDVGSGTESLNVPAGGVIGTRLAQIPSGASAVNDVAFRGDDDDDDNDNGDGNGGLHLALAQNDAVGVQVMDESFTQPVCALQTGPAAAVAYSPDGDWLAAGTERGGLLLITAEGCRIAVDVAAHDGGVTDIAFSPDGEWLVTGGRDGMLKLHTLEGRPLASLSVGAAVEAVAVDPDSGWIASVDASGQLVLWGVP